jgi:hypothetical protein
LLVEALGWLGTVGTFTAYALVWKGRLSSDSRVYAGLNMAGGVMAGTACALYSAWPSAASNYAWAVLGLHAVIRAYRQPRLAATSLATTAV